MVYRVVFCKELSETIDSCYNKMDIGQLLQLNEEITIREEIKKAYFKVEEDKHKNSK
ncbi:MAG: hypothetical protein GY928_16710 [Colwellia sp.]|nr:hypothetical protein [Colwellia sp.]